MKKMLILITIVILSSFSFCYSQEAQTKENDFNYYDNDNYIVGSRKISGSVRFGTGMPDHSVTRTRVSTEDEYIFKTYIIDKLLKSNRILY